MLLRFWLAIIWDPSPTIPQSILTGVQVTISTYSLMDCLAQIPSVVQIWPFFQTLVLVLFEQWFALIQNFFQWNLPYKLISSMATISYCQLSKQAWKNKSAVWSSTVYFWGLNYYSLFWFTLFSSSSAKADLRVGSILAPFILASSSEVNIISISTSLKFVIGFNFCTRLFWPIRVVRNYGG